jgi:hypothetical protein
VQRECAALRIHRVHDYVATRHFHRTVEDPSAVLLDALDGGGDIRDAEIDLPVRRHMRQLGRLVHHAADRPVRALEHVVLAQRAHVERLGRLPGEDLAVEHHRRRRVGGHQLAPERTAQQS